MSILNQKCKTNKSDYSNNQNKINNNLIFKKKMLKINKKINKNLHKYKTNNSIQFQK